MKNKQRRAPSARRRAPRAAFSLALAGGFASLLEGAQAEQYKLQQHYRVIPLPQYHYGANILVECLNRSIETGEHMKDSNGEMQYIPFPTCAETSRPLELAYDVDTAINCTISITDNLFHLLEFYVHNDVPLTCRIPARPPITVRPNPADAAAATEEKQEYVPLVFGLSGTLQLSHLHVSTRLNILLHSAPKNHLQGRRSGVIDSGTAYSTSPLSKDRAVNRRLVIGDDLPLIITVRWFPTLSLPSANGQFGWNGMGEYVNASMVFYVLGGFGAGYAVCAAYFWSVVLPLRLRRRNLGGATPLAGYGIGTVGNGWSIGSGKRTD